MHAFSEKPPGDSLFQTQNDWSGRGQALSQKNFGATDKSPRHMIFTEGKDQSPVTKYMYFKL